MSTGRLSVFFSTTSTILFVSNLFNSDPKSSLLASCRPQQTTGIASKNQVTSFDRSILRWVTTESDYYPYYISAGYSNVTMFSRASAYYKTPALYLAQN